MRLITPLGKAAPATALAALLAACSSSGSPPPPAPPAPPTPPSAAEAPPTPRLLAYDWDLSAAYDAGGQLAPGWRLDGRPAPRLHFEGDRLSVLNLCNIVGAGFALNGNRIQVSRPMSTLRACADRDLMGLEQRVSAQLPQAQRYELRTSAADTPQLMLHFADGSRWEMAGSPTPATRYGSSGERMFLEVAPQLVPCHHPLMPNAQCLRVRDVQYGPDGVRLGMGDWRIFQGGIDGYRHEAGIRNVLRVHRYPLARNGLRPADAPTHAWVLDMVIESERMP